MNRRFVLAAIILAALVLCVVVYAASCVTPSGGGGGIGGGREVIMTVNGRKIYSDEFLKSFVVRNALRQFASVCTLKEEATKKGIKLDPAKVAAKIEEQKAQMVQMGQDWQQFLEQQNLTEKDVEDQVSMYMLFEELVNSMVEVTPEQVQATWDKNKDQIITDYLMKNKLPDTEKPKVTFEQCKDLATEMAKRENQGSKQTDVTDQLTGLTTIVLDGIKDPAERKLYEDLVLNNLKKQAEEKKAAPEEPTAVAPPAGEAGADAAPAPEGEQKEAPKDKGDAGKGGPSPNPGG